MTQAVEGYQHNQFTQVLLQHVDIELRLTMKRRQEAGMSKESFGSTCSVMYSRTIRVVSSTLRRICRAVCLAYCLYQEATKGCKAVANRLYISRMQRIAVLWVLQQVLSRY